MLGDIVLDIQYLALKVKRYILLMMSETGAEMCLPHTYSTEIMGFFK